MFYKIKYFYTKKATIKNIFLVVIIFLFFNSTVNGQFKLVNGNTGLNVSKLNYKKEESSKNFFAYFTIGLFEITSIGVGYNISPDWGIAIKSNIFLLRSRFFINGAEGLGIKIHKRIFKNKKFRLFDTINLEASIGSNNFNKDITRCKEIELDLASESDGDSGLNFYYSFGMGYSYENRSGDLLLPSIKFGMIYIF